MEPELMKSNDYDYRVKLIFSKSDIAELLYFFFESGWISHEEHEYVHEFVWRLKVEMDKFYPNWNPSDLRKICKELRDAI